MRELLGGTQLTLNAALGLMFQKCEGRRAYLCDELPLGPFTTRIEAAEAAASADGLSPDRASRDVTESPSAVRARRIIARS
jgi:hypothetical protein